ncbi:MAG: DoxX family protein [Fluviicola sp.]|nr:MAG: DoxX family protein [Fluviicola sp.]
MNTALNTKVGHFSQAFLRVAIATAFFSAVMDRFGIWGPPGTENVSWGNWENFLAYSNTINFYASPAIGSFLAIVATILEILFGVLLIIGFKTRQIAFGTGILLTLFGIPMVFAFGIHPTFTYSVWVGAAGAFLLASVPTYKWGVDSLLGEKRKSSQE